MYKLKLEFYLIFLSIALIYSIPIHKTKLFDNETICTTITCDKQPHTMCLTQQINVASSCKSSQLYDIEHFSTVNMKQLLIMGHNGLRERIAIRMGVANMVKLIWDDELSQMAQRHAQRCTPFVDDVCTHFDYPLQSKEMYEYFSNVNHPERFIAQNRYCTADKYIPINLVEMTMRSWYFDKNKLKQPKITIEPMVFSKIAILKGENNFTHLAHPLTYRLGCSVAKIDNQFCIFCNYYPYFRGYDGSMFFEYDDPCSLCPASFPLRDIYFPNICTGDQLFDELNGHADHRLNGVKLVHFILIIIIGLMIEVI